MSQLLSILLKLLPKHQILIKSAKKQQHSLFTNLHEVYFQGSLSHLHSVDQKFRLHALSLYMIFLLCSFLHLQTLEAGNSRTLVPARCLVVWRGITGNTIPSLYSPQFIQSSLKCYHPTWDGSSYYTMEHTYIVSTALTLYVVDRFFN